MARNNDDLYVEYNEQLNGFTNQLAGIRTKSELKALLEQVKRTGLSLTYDLPEADDMMNRYIELVNAINDRLPRQNNNDTSSEWSTPVSTTIQRSGPRTAVDYRREFTPPPQHNPYMTPLHSHMTPSSFMTPQPRGGKHKRSKHKRSKHKRTLRKRTLRKRTLRKHTKSN